MATKPDYEVGTIAVSANGTTVTGTGTLWVAADITPGDMFGASGYPMARIVSVNSNTSLTIEPWRGATLAAGSAYFIRYQPDGSRFTAALRTLVASISGGSLAALQALTGAANRLPYFTSSTAMALTPITDAGRALLNSSGTPTGNQGVFITGTASSALFDFTAVGRIFVGQASYADMRTLISAQPAGSYQPLSSNLTALAGATGSVALGYRTGNAVGTVSQSGGAPTGAIIERGSNANGEYVRYADGTQICWIGSISVPGPDTATGVLFQSASATTWTFPIAFTGLPVCSAGASNATSRWVVVLLTSATSADVRAMAGASSASATNVKLMAVGRWF